MRGARREGKYYQFEAGDCASNTSWAVILIHAAMTPLIPVAIAVVLGALAASQEVAPPVPVATAPAVTAKPAPAASTPIIKDKDGDAKRENRERELREQFLPSATSSEEYRKLAAALGLSEHDLTILEEQIAFATLQRDDLEKKLGRTIASVLPAAFRYDPRSNTFDPRYTPELIALHQHRDAILQALQGIEEPILKVLRNGSEIDRRIPLEDFLLARATARTPAASRIPGAAIDLRELIAAIVPPSDAQSPLGVMTRRYALELNAALDTRFIALRAIQAERATLLVGLGPEWHLTKSREEAAQIESELDLLNIREAESEFTLRDLNARWVELLRKSFAAELGLRLPRLWIERTHPEIDEEERMLRKLVDVFTAAGVVTPKDAAAMTDVLLATIERLAPLTRAAANASDKALALAMANDPALVEQRLRHQANTLAVQSKRRAVVRESVRTLDRILPSAALELRPLLEDTMQALAALDRADAFTHDGLLNAAAAAGLADPETLPVPLPESPREGEGTTSDPNVEPEGEATPSNNAPPVTDRGRPRGSRKRPIP